MRANRVVLLRGSARAQDWAWERNIPAAEATRRPRNQFQMEVPFPREVSGLFVSSLPQFPALARILVRNFTGAPEGVFSAGKCVRKIFHRA